MPGGPDLAHSGWISVVPALCVLVLALLSRRTFEALIGGCLVGYVILDGGSFFQSFASSLLSVMQQETIAWIILVCGLFGALIRMLVVSGASLAFGDFVARRVKGPRGALLATWILGLTIFIDDYLNALAVGSSMRRVTDRYKVSREMLAYVVDSTAAPICVLVPLSTWAFYVSGLLEENGVAESGGGLAAYISSVPFVFYAWAAVLLVPLVALGVVPTFGPMRRAHARAAEGAAVEVDDAGEDSALEPRMVNYLVPIAVLIGATIAFGIDALRGVIAAVFVTAILFRAQGVKTAILSRAFFDGFANMLLPLGIVVLSFVLLDINERLRLSGFVIETVRPWMDGGYLPAVTFLSLSVITFATGSFWGVYAIALPIVIPLANELGVAPALAVGSVISAGALGSHACFYGDSTVLSSTSCGCDNVDHALTQLPFALLAAAVATVCYLFFGVIL